MCYNIGILTDYYRNGPFIMNRSAIKDFTKGNITKQLVLFSLPLFLSNLLQVVYNMVDMIVVGRELGEIGISAVSIGGDVTNFMTFIAIGFANAGQVLIAKYVGAKRRNRIGTFVGTMCGFLVVAATVVSAVSLLLRHQFLSWMRTPAESYEGAMQYSVISMVGLVLIYGYNAVGAILRGMGDSKTPFVFISDAAVLNVVLDILFVTEMEMGAGGAALATVISQAVSFLLCTCYLIWKRASFELDLRVRDFVKWDGECLSELVKLGTPMAIKMASVQFSKLFVNSWINGYGTTVSAFAGIANKISNISNLISAAMNTAGSTMVGQNLAAREYGRVNRILLNLTVITVSISALMSVMFCLFPEEILGIFMREEEGADVLAIGMKYIPIGVLLFFGSALRAIMNALLNGSGNYRINFVTAILDGIVMRIGLALLFGLAFGMQHYGFWLGDALAGFTPFWVGLVFYLSGRWKSDVPEKEHK